MPSWVSGIHADALPRVSRNKTLGLARVNGLAMNHLESGWIGLFEFGAFGSQPHVPQTTNHVKGLVNSRLPE